MSDLIFLSNTFKSYLIMMIANKANRYMDKCITNHITMSSSYFFIFYKNHSVSARL